MTCTMAARLRHVGGGREGMGEVRCKLTLVVEVAGHSSPRRSAPFIIHLIDDRNKESIAVIYKESIAAIQGRHLHQHQQPHYCRAIYITESTG
jgi:hypothetical protein